MGKVNNLVIAKLPSVSATMQDAILRCLVKMYLDVRSPFIANLIISLQSGSIPKLDLDPTTYDNAHLYFCDAQAAAFIKKNIHYDFGIDRTQTAMSKWCDAELKCSETNFNLRNPLFLRDLSKNVTGLLTLMRKYLTKVLGKVPTDIYNLQYGPGCTATCRGFKSSLPNKLENDFALYTHTHVSFVEELLLRNPLWAQSFYSKHGLECDFRTKIQYLYADELDFVPKDWKQDRGICIGAGLNAVLQSNVSDYLVSRLKRFGFDLRHLPEKHKHMARKSSVDGSLATIDLQSASDTIAYELVRAVLPYEWFVLLDNLRAKRTKLPDGCIITLEKFSAMGNGFTFELETLIFMAACWATAQLEDSDDFVYSVFGDDIIISTHLAEPLIRNLANIGFTTNKDKTFVHGPFRESCGGDYFRGIPVRPIYFKEFSDDVEGFYQLANRIRDFTSSITFSDFCDSRFMDIWQSVVAWIPENFRFGGPDGIGDSVLISSREEWVGFAVYHNQQLRVNTLERAYARKGRGYAKTSYGKLMFGLYKLGLVDRDLLLEARQNFGRDNYSIERLKRSLVGGVDDGQILGKTGYSLVKKRRYVHYSGRNLSWV